MIETAEAVQFDKVASSGRTGPAFLTCETASGETIEVVAKLSARCDLREVSLAMELLCAVVAADVGLPVPEPFLIDLDPAWIDSIPNKDWAAAARRSARLAFGSKRVPPGFNAWVVGTPLRDAPARVAAGALLFDAIADNADRRDANPNCLIRGSELRLIDHEMCFSPAPLIGWRPPWELGALQHMERPGAHIFRAALQGRLIDWDPIRDAWANLSDKHLADYSAILPMAWRGARPAVDEAVRKLREARDKIDGCLAEVKRVLT